jgi:hypothetical protein
MSVTNLRGTIFLGTSKGITGVVDMNLLVVTDVAGKALTEFLFRSRLTPGIAYLLILTPASERLSNGNQLLEVDDSTFTGAGMLGLWTKADSVTLFDQMTYGETKWLIGLIARALQTSF